MKALSMYVWSLLVIMMMGLTSCGDDDELQFSEEQLAYINKNKEYIWEKKTEKDEMGELRYKQVVLGGDTALYRIIRKENEWTTTPTMTSVVYLLGLEAVREVLGDEISFFRCVEFFFAQIETEGDIGEKFGECF